MQKFEHDSHRCSNRTSQLSGFQSTFSLGRLSSPVRSSAQTKPSQRPKQCCSDMFSCGVSALKGGIQQLGSTSLDYLHTTPGGSLSTVQSSKVIGMPKRLPACLLSRPTSGGFLVGDGLRRGVPCGCTSPAGNVTDWKGATPGKLSILTRESSGDDDTAVNAYNGSSDGRIACKDSGTEAGTQKSSEESWRLHGSKILEQNAVLKRGCYMAHFSSPASAILHLVYQQMIQNRLAKIIIVIALFQILLTHPHTLLADFPVPGTSCA